MKNYNISIQNSYHLIKELWRKVKTRLTIENPKMRSHTKSILSYLREHVNHNKRKVFYLELYV